MRKQLYFSFNKLLSFDVDKYYKEFFNLYSTNNSLVWEKKLENVLCISSKKIPYYSKLENTQRYGLSHYPILDKEIINTRFNQFIHIDFERNLKYGSIKVQTGGSSGIPITVIHDCKMRSAGRASRLFSKHLCNFPIPEAHWLLWGSMTEINNMKNGLMGKANNFFLNQKGIMNAFLMSEDKMNTYVNLINENNIENLVVYVDSATELAKFIQRTGKKVKKLKNIMGCAGTITNEDRAIIEETFSCKLYNKYGSRECSDIACECNQGNIHIYENHVKVEIVDNFGKTLPNGELGRILITTLNNEAFPLIRYEIGDIGSIRHINCLCGIEGMCFEQLVGRSYEMLKNINGEYVTPVYIRHLLGVIHNPLGIINRFQLIQKDLDKYHLLLEVSKNYELKVEHLNNINIDLKKVLGVSCEIQIEILNKIPENPNGKYSYIKTELKN